MKKVIKNILCNNCRCSISDKSTKSIRMSSSSTYWLCIGFMFLYQMQIVTGSNHSSGLLVGNGGGGGSTTGTMSIPMMAPRVCENVRSLFEKRGISSSDVPIEPITGKYTLIFFFFFS